MNFRGWALCVHIITIIHICVDHDCWEINEMEFRINYERTYAERLKRGYFTTNVVGQAGKVAIGGLASLVVAVAEVTRGGGRVMVNLPWNELHRPWAHYTHIPRYIDFTTSWTQANGYAVIPFLVFRIQNPPSYCYTLHMTRLNTKNHCDTIGPNI